MNRIVTVLLVLAATACATRRASTPSAPPADGATSTGSAGPGADATAVDRSGFEPSCMAAAEEDPTAWGLRDDLLFAAWIDPAADGVTTALERLAAYVSSPGRGISVTTAFALAHLPDEYAWVSDRLAEARLAPRALVRAATTSGVALWIVPHDCPREGLERHLAGAWHLTFEPGPRGRTGRPMEGAVFPYVAILTAEGPLLLVPEDLESSYWAHATTPPSTAIAPRGAPIDDALAALPAAPVRVVLRQHGFVAGASPTALLAGPDGVGTPDTLRPP
ncbi:MAG: hypothetical protein D6705_09750 [Deltaproteobacteria bacterium]|nr:MAG: hypothetical protein D6705_09750 [Deltaproteobacteria bacterium]